MLPNEISPKETLIIAKGLLDYEFIMANRQTASTNAQAFKEFTDVYYDFYLKARWAVMKKPNNSAIYFDMLQNTAKETELLSIVETFKSRTGGKSYEFSICSKLLHTIDPSLPIYDSKVRSYLTKQRGVDLWFNIKSKPAKEMIMHDWKLLCDWYTEFQESDEGKQWIAWFDETFPQHVHISSVKKIDFIIFAKTDTI